MSNQNGHSSGQKCGSEHQSWGYLWMIPVFMLIFSRSFGAFIVGIVIAIAISIIISAAQKNMWRRQLYQQQQYYTPPQQYYQPIRQPEQPYYQPTRQPEQPYSTYQAGYQAPEPEKKQYSEGGKQYAYPQYQGEASTQYEQPKAQYPEQMPPMQQ